MPMEPQSEFVTDDVVLGDFGLTARPGTPAPYRVQSPAIFCAPERVHGKDPSFASDIWSYTCLFGLLYTSFPIFGGTGHATAISSVVGKLGPLPASWEGTYFDEETCKPDWYDPNRTAIPELSIESLILRVRPDINPAELRLVLALLRWGLAYLPEDRATASQLLHSTLSRSSWIFISRLYCYNRFFITYDYCMMPVGT